MNAGKEGAPIPEELVWLVAYAFAQRGKLEECLVTILSFDGYLRSEDWANLFFEDLFQEQLEVKCQLENTLPVSATQKYPGWPLRLNGW